jgi:hypothetical protein
LTSVSYAFIYTYVHISYVYIVWSRDSSVGIATRYGLDGPGIESRWQQDFPHPSRPVLRPTQPLIQWVPGLSREVKRSGRGVDHTPPSKAEVKESVELCLYPLWAFVGSYRVNCTFLYVAYIYVRYKKKILVTSHINTIFIKSNKCTLI